MKWVRSDLGKTAEGNTQSSSRGPLPLGVDSADLEKITDSQGSIIHYHFRLTTSAAVSDRALGEGVNKTAGDMLSALATRVRSSLPYRQLCSSITTKSEQEQLELLRRGIAPATGRELKEVAADIWGHTKDPVGPGHRSGQKLLRRPLRGPLYTSWYPTPISSVPDNPFKLTPKQQRWKEKLKILRASGKGPPKKGAGKRSK